MASLVHVGFEAFSERELFVIEVARLDEVPPDFVLPSRYFACLLVCDTTTISETEVADLARRILEAGCVYIFCWGPGCERVHDLFDQADLELRPDGPFAMSTCHSKEALSKALWFFLYCTFPDEVYFDQRQVGVGIIIGSKEWADEVRVALSLPEEFGSRLLSSEREPA